MPPHSGLRFSRLPTAGLHPQLHDVATPWLSSETLSVRAHQTPKHHRDVRDVVTRPQQDWMMQLH